MPREGVPKRILKLRRIGAVVDWWSVAPAVFADGRRTLGKWLADPQFSEDLKAGDAELLARFEAHHAQRRRPKFDLLTQAEMEAFTPEEIEHMIAVELQRTYAATTGTDFMPDVEGQTVH